MNPKLTALLILLNLILIGCNFNEKTSEETETNSTSEVKIAGAMKNVMWKGELDGVIKLDSIKNKKGLYGLGPLSFMRGEILIDNGRAYISKVESDSTIIVEENFEEEAPFFVYANATEWEEVELPSGIKNLKDLERFIDKKTREQKRPFVFKLEGIPTSAVIHIQNLPEGTKVNSPADAHQGQVSYELENETVSIVGFFSTTHQGVFTHHDSFLHMHLLSEDHQKMGHLDSLTFGDEKMKLYLPEY